MPFNDVSETLDPEFVYSITAEKLRRRLGRAGYDRGSLEKERWEYYKKVVSQSDLKHLHFTGKSAEAKSDAFRRSMLDNWLDALEQVVKSRLNTGSRAKPTKNLLVDIITGAEKPPFLELEPAHGFLGFPCSTFNNMAVALLEVTDGKAVCELDVTPFILHRDDTTFDDLLGREEEYYEL
ncbi:HEPN/Toprim-associated domain-containing protein [uncultured Paraburkholderia sp.]|uniref:HEPN/Toprim-associated domain-containing protein n=1 Tax=uncultured Paraburkholderia sp. TaxID=1822466 RepID=UPI0025969C0C|nr:HEPN/Toprim-associated domain-containing protein [uncultured Paraburkholderia sp.]